MDDTRKYRRKQKKKRLLLKTILATALIAILAVGTGAWYVVNQLNDTASSAYQGLNRGEMSELRVEPVDIGKDNFSMLILGSDFREGDSGGERTDTMLVATFNKGDRSIKLTSIPRDTYTEIIGYTEGPFYDKINHANAFGGIDMAIDTVENLLDIPIDHYALARFDGLVDIIDALDGIEIDVTYEFDFKEKKVVMSILHLQKDQPIWTVKKLSPMLVKENRLRVVEIKDEAFVSNKLLKLLLTEQHLFLALPDLTICLMLLETIFRWT